MSLAVLCSAGDYKGRCEMKSYEAMGLMVGKYAAAMAKRLGLGNRMIYRWCEPTEDYSDSGAYNPLDRLEAMMNEAEGKGQSSLEVLAPLRYLATGRAKVIPIPVIECTPEDLLIQATKTMKEVSEGLAKAAESLGKETLTPIERKETLKELDEAVHELLTLEGMFRA